MNPLLQLFKKKRLEYFFHTGLKHLENDQPIPALKYGKKLIEVEPSFSGGYEILASSQELLGEKDNFFNTLENGIKKAPLSYLLQEKISVHYSDSNRFEEAFSAINKAIELAPKMPSLYFNKAVIFAKCAKYRECAETLEYLINHVDDTFFDAYILQAQLLNSFGKPEVAIERLKVLVDGNLGRFGVPDLDELLRKIYSTLIQSYHLINDTENEETCKKKLEDLKSKK